MSQHGQIGITEAQIDLLDAAQRFCREQSPMDKVRALISSDLGYDRVVWEKIGQLGWLAMTLPEAYGGVGLTLTEAVPVAEQMGRYMLAAPFISTTLAAQALMTAGLPAQKNDYLTKIATGSAATLALSESDGGWNLASLQSMATHDENGGYTLAGTKVLVMHLRAANFVIVSATLKGAPALFLIETKDIPNQHIRRETLIDETQRSYELKLDGLRVAETARLDLEQTRAALERVHLAANLLGAAQMTGGCQAVIDYTVEYLNTRKQFGKLIGSFQALKHPTVDAFVDYQLSRSLLYAAAYSFERQGEGEIATRMAKAQADKALSFAADRSIQFHGGFGFTYDCDAQLYRRSGIFNASQFGDAAYHKKKLAELLL